MVLPNQIEDRRYRVLGRDTHPKRVEDLRGAPVDGHLVLVVLIPCAGVIKKEVLAVQQALLGLLELLLMLSLTGLVDDDDLFL